MGLRKTAGHGITLGSVLVPALLAGAEFEIGILAPAAIRQNETFEVVFTLTSRGIASTEEGARGWTISVAHEGLDIIEATIEGTDARKRMRNGFDVIETTATDAEHPGNDGFVSAVILGMATPITLPPEGTFSVARAFYRAGPRACAGAKIAVADGLVGSGNPVMNRVTWKMVSFSTSSPAPVSWTSCAPNDYVFRIAGPWTVGLPIGERRRFPAEVRLGQAAATATAWTLAVAHDPEVLDLVRVSLDGTGLEGLFEAPGFALFEIVSGPGNVGFIARAEIAPATGAVLPAPEGAVATAEYEVLLHMDPAEVGSRIETSIWFPASLRGAGGPVSSGVLPEGNLKLEPLDPAIDILPPSAFIRGDSNGDGAVDLADVLVTLFHLFAGEPAGCIEAADGDDDGHVGLSDAILVARFLFLAGDPPAEPSAACGPDPTLPSLGCEQPSCR